MVIDLLSGAAPPAFGSGALLVLVTAIVEIECDYCAVTEREFLGTWPDGWWSVPGIGKADDRTGHVCPECALKDDIYPKIIEARAGNLARMMGEAADGEEG